METKLDKERQHINMRSYRCTGTVLARPMSKQAFKNCYRGNDIKGKNGAGYYIIDMECEKWLNADEFEKEFEEIIS